MSALQLIAIQEKCAKNDNKEINFTEHSRNFDFNCQINFRKKCWFLTARLRFVVDVLGKLFSIPRKKLTFTTLLENLPDNSGRHCSESTKLVEVRAACSRKQWNSVCPLIYWTFHQRVLCSYGIACFCLLLFQNVFSNLFNTNLFQ